NRDYRGRLDRRDQLGDRRSAGAAAEHSAEQRRRSGLHTDAAGLRFLASRAADLASRRGCARGAGELSTGLERRTRHSARCPGIRVNAKCKMQNAKEMRLSTFCILHFAFDRGYVMKKLLIGVAVLALLGATVYGVFLRGAATETITEAPPATPITAEATLVAE